MFNTKNRVEAEEAFPQANTRGEGFKVNVKTTNSFLGDVLDLPENAARFPKTYRMSKMQDDANEYYKKMQKEQRKQGQQGKDNKSTQKIKNKKIQEKARIIAQGPQFAQLAEGLLVRGNPGEYDERVQGAVNGILNNIRYAYKAEVLHLLGLAKSFALDPRVDLTDSLKAIVADYDFDLSFEEVQRTVAERGSWYGGRVLDALNATLGYDFTRKGFLQEIIAGTVWLMNITMPMASKDKYTYEDKDRGFKKEYNLGEMRDFNDDLWFTAIHANEIHWPHYDIVLADEVQDFNIAQKIMLQKLHEAGAKIVAVGDPNQCHPPGTMISLTGGGEIAIEKLEPGTQLVNYQTGKSHFSGVSNQGIKVLEKSVRNYSGELVKIITASKNQRCTPNHRCLVRFVEDPKKYGLYLMMRGESARLGVCRLKYKEFFGLRAKQEEADRAWLLQVFQSEQDARIAESVTSTRFGISQVIGNAVPNAMRCLESFGRDVNYPLWNQSCKNNYIGSRKSFVTQACNLISGAIEVKIFDGSPKGGSWEEAVITREPYIGPVYSIKVEPNQAGKHLYVADGIVTHNSIYRFRGADSSAFKNLGEMLEGLSADKSGVHQSLTGNFRSREAILDFSNEMSHVKNLKPGRKYKDNYGGEVTYREKTYTDAFNDLSKEMDKFGWMKNTAFIARTNEPLVHAALECLKGGIPFIIVGKDIANDLVSHIQKVMNKFKYKTKKELNIDIENAPCDYIQEKLQEYNDDKKSSWFGDVTKSSDILELKEITDALIMAISSFMNESGSGNASEKPHDPYRDPFGYDDEDDRRGGGRRYTGPPVSQFQAWLFKKLGGLDVAMNEDDLKEYRRKIEYESPVVLTTAHKSKGLEFARVFVLRDDLFPHPKNKHRPKDLLQEENARYVTYTRAMNELHVLDLKGQPGVPDKETR